MAKSSWLSINPMSGTGDATVTNTGQPHTGRLVRATTVTATVKDMDEKKTYKVNQKALTEFVNIVETQFEADPDGDKITVSGTANSPRLTFAVASGATASVTVPETFTVNSSTANNATDIPGDPGASAQYSFTAVFVVAQNREEVAKSATITVVGGSAAANDSFSILQGASDWTYTLSLNATTTTIGAGGGSSTITGTLKSYLNGHDEGSRVITPILTGTGTGFTIDGNVITAADRETTVGAERSIALTASFSDTPSQETATATISIYQAANAETSITYGDVVISKYTINDISAAGGTVQAATALEYSQTRTQNYTSGATKALSTLTSGGTVTYSDPVSAVSLATTEKIRTKVGSMTVVVTMNSKSATKALDIYQAANSATYGNVSLTGLTSPVDVNVTGTSYTLPGKASQTVSYTSGSTRAGNVSIVYTETTAQSGFSLSNGVVTVTNNTSGDAREGYVITATATGEGSKSATQTVTFNQSAGYKTYSAITLTATYADIPASGGTKTPTVTYSQTWGWNGSTTGGGTITSGGTVTYSGTGVSTSNGGVTAASLGQTAKDRTLITTATVSVSLNGKSASKEVNVYQAKNALLSTTYNTPTITSFTVSDIPASGGTISSGTVKYSQTWSRTYDSGTYTQTAITTGGELTYGSAVTASSLGTTEKDRTKVGTLTVTVKLNGKTSAQASADVYQAANDLGQTVYDTPVISAFTVSDVPAGGGTVSSGTVTYSQAWRKVYSSGTVEQTPITTGGTLNYGDAVTIASKGTTISARNDTGKDLTVTVTLNGKTSAQSSASIYQALNKVTSVKGHKGDNASSDVHISYATTTIGAAGGTVSPTVQGAMTLTFSSGSTVVNTTNGSAYGGTAAFSRTYSGSATGFTLGSSGSVTAADRATTVGSARSIKVTSVLTVTFTNPSSVGGNAVTDTASCEATITQSANSQTTVYDTPTISTFTVGDIPAAGGTVSSGTVTYSQAWRYTYSSGDSVEQTAITSGATPSYSTAVTASSLGTTVKSRTKINSLTVTIALNGKSASKSVDVYQAANSATYGAVSITQTTPVALAVTGQTYTFAPILAQTVSFTSGSTRAGSVSATYAVKTAKDGYSLSSGKVTVTANTSTSARNGFVVTITASGEGSKSATKDVTFNQAAGSYSYADPVLTVTYADISAGGSTVTPTVSYSQTYGWNGSTSGAGTITSGGTVTYSGTSVNTTNGSVSASSLGTTVKARTKITTATVKVTLNGKSASKSVDVYQAANSATSIIYGTPSVTLTVSDIPASGGTISSGTATYSQSRTQNYSSGSTSALSALTSGGTANYGTAVTASSRGTTIGARTSAGTLTVTITMNGKTSAQSSATVYQALNKVISVKAHKSGDASSDDHFYYGTTTIGAGGGTVSPTGNANFTATFSSGSTATIGSDGSQYGGTAAFSRTYSGSATGFTLNASTGAVTAADRETTVGGARSISVTSVLTTTFTNPSSVGGGAVSDTASASHPVTQSANSSTYSSLSLSSTSKSVEYSSGSFSLSATANYTWSSGSTSTSAVSASSVTWSSNATGWLTVSGGTVSYTTNTGTSSRSGTITATYSGKSATCSVSQSYDTTTLSVSPTSMSFTASGGSKTLTITSNGSWTVS